MEIILKYGQRKINFHISGGSNIDFVIPPISETDIIRDQKINYSSLYHVIQSKKIGSNSISVGIAINDKTRPVPYSFLIPNLIDELRKANIHPENIKFFITNGTHVPDNDLNYLKLPHDYLNQFKFFQHNSQEADNLVFLGKTSFNTPILLNKSFFECDLKISIGNIEPHHFAGYSGGAKTVAIGLAGAETINHNHSLLLDPNSVICQYEDNKVRQDIEEIGEASGLDLVFNCVQTSNQEILKLYFDKPKLVMTQAIPFIKGLFTTEVKTKYDVVIASAGGYPKDINLYQSQKAFSNASRILKDNGKLILLAECSEGIGSENYYNYINNFSSPKDILEDFLSQPFAIGKHKAFLMAKLQLKNDVYLYSRINSSMVRNCLITPIKNLNNFFSSLVEKMDNASIAIMPNAVTTIPIVNEIK